LHFVNAKILTGQVQARYFHYDCLSEKKTQNISQKTICLSNQTSYKDLI